MRKARIPSVLLLTIFLSLSVINLTPANALFQISIDRAVVGQPSVVDLTQYPIGTQFDRIDWWIQQPGYNNTPTTSSGSKTYVPKATAPIDCDGAKATLWVEVSASGISGGTSRASKTLDCGLWPEANYPDPRIINKTRSTGEFLPGDKFTFDSGSSGRVNNPPPADFLDSFSCTNCVYFASGVMVIPNEASVGSVSGITFRRNYFGYKTPNAESWTGTVVVGPKLTAPPLPTISGSATAGSTLTGNPGIWEAGVSLTYRWLNSVGNPVGTSSTLLLSQSDIGQTYAFEVTAKKPGFITAVVKSASLLVGPGQQKLTPLPSISGNAIVGGSIIGNPGQWDTGVDLWYQWVIDGKTKTNTNSLNYVPSPSDLGHAISLQVTGSKAGLMPVTTSSTELIIGPGALKITPMPQISATAATVGSTISSEPGLWDAGVTFTYQWLRDGIQIPDAIAKNYVVTLSDVSHSLKVQVTGTLPGYTPVQKTSVQLTVGLSALQLKPKPSILGTPKAGNVLTTSPGNWDAGVKIDYQWLRNGAIIPGATSASYNLNLADVGYLIAIQVTASKAGFNSVVTTSDSLAVYADVPQKVTPQPSAGKPNIPIASTSFIQTTWTTPWIEGISRVGKSMIVETGLWASGVNFGWQWLRNGQPIIGANKSTYKATSKDLGQKISVQVVGHLNGFKDMLKTSPALKVLK